MAPRSKARALVLLLDQFPRQIWRDTAMAFAGDRQALAESWQAVERGWLEAEPEQARRQFWLMPLMHSEDLAVQEAALPLFERFADPRTADFARRHRDVIARFGRFPHRNAALGRLSAAGELLAFLPLRGRLRLEQRRLTAGHHLPDGHFQALAPAVVAERLEVQHLAAIAQPALLRREWRPFLVTDVHGLLRPPLVPSPAGRCAPGCSPPQRDAGTRCVHLCLHGSESLAVVVP